MLGKNPPPVLDFLLNLLESRDKPGALITALLENGVVATAISNPAVMSLDQAIRLARAAMRLDRRLDIKILRHLTGRPHDAPSQEMMRALKVIEAISDCRCLVIPLMKFVKLPQRHLRSKAVKLLARASRNGGWADSILNDSDPRVRSNLIEGVVEQLGQKAIPLLRKAATDSHHRVAITSLLALARFGDEPSRHILETMAVESSDWHQRAAAWALRQLAADATAVNPSSEVPHPSV